MDNAITLLGIHYGLRLNLGANNVDVYLRHDDKNPLRVSGPAAWALVKACDRATPARRDEILGNVLFPQTAL